MYSVYECTFWSDILCTLHMYFVSDSSAASDSTSHQVLHGHALPAGVVQAAAGHEEVRIWRENQPRQGQDHWHTATVTCRVQLFFWEGGGFVQRPCTPTSCIILYGYKCLRIIYSHVHKCPCTHVHVHCTCCTTWCEYTCYTAITSSVWWVVKRAQVFVVINYLALGGLLSHIIVYTHFFPHKVSLVVSTNDSRSQPLVFKASIYGLRSDLLLVDFRRSTVSLYILHTYLHVGSLL